MKISDNALNMLTAKSYKGIGRKWINDKLKGASSVEVVVSRLAEKAEEVDVADFESRKAEIRRKIEVFGSAIDGVTGFGDEDFPVISERIKPADRPIALFYRGDLSLIRRVGNNIAVIGSLDPDEAICREEGCVVRQLVSQGKCIVSGLALGCDTIAHTTTLATNGKTVAFLSSPLDEVNPPSNRPLAERIVETGGLLVSEYYEKAHSRNEFLARYPERDRLQAMFASVVVLAASYLPGCPGCDSGSRFAMGKAMEYGIPRAVIYNAKRHVGNRMFDMNRDAIANGAYEIDPDNEATMVVPQVRECGLSQTFLFGIQ